MKSIIQHLRLPFSLLLMPVFLFSCYVLEVGKDRSLIAELLLLFFILHGLVYPSSNAYNSTQDRDEGSVGLIKKPLPVPKTLIPITVILDCCALILCYTIHLYTAVLLLIYIIASRLYSYRGVRLKKYPILGFLIVFICQGALVFWMVKSVIVPDINGKTFIESLPMAFVSSLFIGSIYPLSQIYQHEQDKKDGVYTISAMLGYRNTFIFSGIQFMLASLIFNYFLFNDGRTIEMLIYNTSQLPVIIFFLIWFYRVIKDHAKADFKHTMQMNIISAVSMNICFIILLLKLCK